MYLNAPDSFTLNDWLYGKWISVRLTEYTRIHGVVMMWSPESGCVCFFLFCFVSETNLLIKSWQEFEFEDPKMKVYAPDLEMIPKTWAANLILKLKFLFSLIQWKTPHRAMIDFCVLLNWIFCKARQIEVIEMVAFKGLRGKKRIWLNSLVISFTWAGADPREMVSVSDVGLLVLTGPLVDIIRKAESEFE